MTQHLHPHLTTWHITWSTFGARPHGGDRPTVDKSHNQPGEEFIEASAAREKSVRDRMKFPPVILSRDQQRFIESIIPTICQRGRWELRTCAAGPDHVHVLLDVDPRIHGERVRRLLKRWIGQALSEGWQILEGASWWAEEGSNLAVHDHVYLNRAYPYVKDQRATPALSCAQIGAGDGPARGA